MVAVCGVAPARMVYQVAGRSIIVEALDAWSSNVVRAFFAGWHLAEADVPYAGQVASVIRLRQGFYTCPVRL
jgi:hypothetical protein